nr:DEAD/DEAH box helicase [[Pseudopropionibacterium] massiliense]
MPRKKPKSFKSDGTPKKRWSAAERAARGHKPRRSGGVRNPDARSGRSDRYERARGRDDRGGPGREDRGFGRDGNRDGDRSRRDDRGWRDDRGSGQRRGGARSRHAWRDDRDTSWGRGGGRGDRVERRRDDFRQHDDFRGRDGDRRRGDRDGGEDRRRRDRDFDRDFRRDDRPRGFRGSRRDRQEHPYGRRDHERRGHYDRRSGEGRGRFRESRDLDPVEQDQMSWEAATVEVEVTDDDAASGFAELGVAAPMVAALKQQGITEPFPIQRATIADAIAGRDVLGRGRTGSGKTLAFGLPLLTRLAAGDPTGTPRAVILTPTRELALQIADNLSPLATVMGLRLYLVAGGMAYGPQIKAFERGVDVVVATPGRLIDLLEQGVADLSQVEVTVLDEADHMSDLGFLPAVTTILDAVPADGQRLLFSATLDGAVDELVRRYIADPVTHEVDSGKASVTTMSHHVLHVVPHHKNQVTAEIANREGRTVVFARTQMGTDRIARQLREAGVMAGALHGGLTQGARARILAAFKRGEVPVLVATDVAARGIHVDDISLVLQVDPPKTSKDYLHRAGRTARAGEAGAVVSIVLPHQRKQMRRIVGQAGVRTEPVEATPGCDELAALTGARPCLGAPVTEADYQALIAPRPQQRRRPGGGRGRGPRRRGDRRDRGHRRERG